MGQGCAIFIDWAMLTDMNLCASKLEFWHTKT